MKKIDFILLAVVLVVALGLRLYKISTPLADLHSFRQVDTAAVARNFARDGIDLMRPVYDDLSNIQTGVENPEGLRMVEFPLYNASIALLYRYIPATSLEIYGRLVSIFSSLITIAVIYYIALKEKNRIAAFGASSIYAVYPAFVFFSRVVLPESMAVAAMMLSLLLLYLSTQQQKKSVILTITAGLLFAVSILIKPTTIFYGFAAVYLFLAKHTFSVFTSWKPYVYFLLGLIPFIAWRVYITQFPEGIPASTWLITTVQTFEGPREIFFRPAFFRWMFMERIGTIILGIYAVPFLILGMLSKYKRLFIPSILFSGFAYLFVFQGGNVQHEYYQTVLFPALSLAVGVGIAQFFELPEKLFNRWMMYPTVVILFILGAFFSYYKVKDYYSYPQDLPRIAELIKIFTNPEDKIVTDRLGDTTLLYLADRKGAPAIYKPLNELRDLGYSYVVTTNKDLSTQYKEEGYQIIVENELFTMIAL